MGSIFPIFPVASRWGRPSKKRSSTRPRRCEIGSTSLSIGAARFPEPRPIEALLADTEVHEDTAAGRALLRSVPLVRHSGRPAKANLSIDSGILAAIDAEAKRRKLSRSAFIELMARRALPQPIGEAGEC